MAISYDGIELRVKIRKILQRAFRKEITKEDLIFLVEKSFFQYAGMDVGDGLSLLCLKNKRWIGVKPKETWMFKTSVMSAFVGDITTLTYAEWLKFIASDICLNIYSWFASNGPLEAEGFIVGLTNKGELICVRDASLWRKHQDG